jgi:hypothetical protein
MAIITHNGLAIGSSMVSMTASIARTDRNARAKKMYGTPN